MRPTKDLVTSLGTRAMRLGLSTLPDRVYWELAARFPISNLGLPIETGDDLLASGERETAQLVGLVSEYSEEFDLGSASVLDIGCGPGRVLVPMAARCGAAYGIDASRAFLSQCRTQAQENGVDVTLARADDRIPDFGTAFDLIFSIKTFQSLRRRQTVNYLREAHTNLAAGGVLYATFPSLESDGNLSALMGEEIDDANPFRNRYFTRDEVRIYLEHFGYTRIEFHSTDVDDPVRDQMVVLASA